MCSYHNKDRKLPGKHGSIKSSVFIGYHEEWKFYDNLLSLHKTPKQKEEHLIVSIEYLKCVQCLLEC